MACTPTHNTRKRTRGVQRDIGVKEGEEGGFGEVGLDVRGFFFGAGEVVSTLGDFVGVAIAWVGRKVGGWVSGGD